MPANPTPRICECGHTEHQHLESPGPRGACLVEGCDDCHAPRFKAPANPTPSLMTLVETWRKRADELQHEPYMRGIFRQCADELERALALMQLEPREAAAFVAGVEDIATGRMRSLDDIDKERALVSQGSEPREPGSLDAPMWHEHLTRCTRDGDGKLIHTKACVDSGCVTCQASRDGSGGSDAIMLDIEYQPEGRCLWHRNCPNNTFRSGIMAETRREPERTLLKCLHCGQHAYFPKGGACVRVPLENVNG